MCVSVQGLNALHLASLQGCVWSVQLLLEAAADVAVIDGMVRNH